MTKRRWIFNNWWHKQTRILKILKPIEKFCLRTWSMITCG